MKLKKLISIILCFCSISALFIFTSAAEEFTLDRTAIVTELGFMENGSNGEFNPENKVTRAEFAEVVCKLINAQTVTGVLAFEDVDINSEEYEYIFSVCSLGLMVGHSGTEFRPNEFITVNEAVKVIMTILGYKEIAEINGGYPAGYFTEASKAGILPDCTGTDYVTKGVLASIVYNTMRAQIREVDTLSENYTVTMGKTVLAKYHSIEFGVGTVSANSVTGLNSINAAGENVISINGYKLKIDNKEYNDLLGYNVEWYAKKNDLDEYHLVCAVPKNMSVTTVNWEDFDRVNSSMTLIRYEVEETEKTVRLTESVNVIYNGVYLFDCTVSDLMPGYGETQFIDSDNDNVYETAVVRSYRTFRVGRLMDSDEMLAAAGSTETVDFSNCTAAGITIIDEGAMVDFTEKSEIFTLIEAGDMLLVAESKSQDCIKIVISDIVVSETVTGKNDEYLITENDTYKLTPFIINKLPELTIGQKFTFYIDDFGNIAEYEFSNTTNTDYAYLIKAKMNGKGSLTSGMSIRVYTVKGTFEELSSGETVFVKMGANETKYTAQQVYDMFVNADQTVNRQLLIYETNSDGTLIRLQLAKPEIGNEGQDYFALNFDNPNCFISYHFHVMARGSGDLPDPLSGMYNLRNAVYMSIPASEADMDNEKMFKVQQGNSLAITSDPTHLQLYDVAANGAVTVAIDVGAAVTYNYAKLHALTIKRIYEVLDEEGNVKLAADGYVKKMPVTYYFGDDMINEARNFKVGDVIFCWINSLNEIMHYESSFVGGELKFVEGYETFYNSSTTGHGINCRDNSTGGGAAINMYQRFAMYGKVTKVDNLGSNMFEVEITLYDLDSQSFDGLTAWNHKYKANIGVTDGSLLIYDSKKNTLIEGNVTDLQIGDSIYLASFRNYIDERYSCVIYR